MIAVPKGNPEGITALADLADPDVKVALCAEQVPCGAAAQKALDAAGVKVTPVTQEQDVKAALTKVKLGEVDAALVYRTDAKAAAADVDGVEFPESAEAINDYPIVALKDAPNPAGAQAFVAYVPDRAGAAGAHRRRVPEALSRPSSRESPRTARPGGARAARAGASWCCRWPGC